MEFLGYKIIKLILLPPGLNIALLVLGFLLLWSKRLLATLLILMATILLYVCSIGSTVSKLHEYLEIVPPVQISNLKPMTDIKGIVILGGGRYASAPEYGGDTVNVNTLERIRYGVKAARELELPIILSGGSVYGEDITEAKLMHDAIKQDFRFDGRVILEDSSRNTKENAEKTLELLKENDMGRVLLITHAFHMPRALAYFDADDIAIVPVPIGYMTRDHKQIINWVPRADNLLKIATICNEIFGVLITKLL